MADLAKLVAATGVVNLTFGHVVMIVVCLTLLYLAIKKQFEPLLLLPIGFGGLLANVPGAVGKSDLKAFGQEVNAVSRSEAEGGDIEAFEGQSHCGYRLRC